MNYSIIAIAFLITILGGLFAIRFKNKIRYLFPFSAGAVIGISFFELIPESLESFEDLSISIPVGLMLLGFMTYFLISKLPFVGHRHSDHESKHIHSDFKASSIIMHSVVDGIAIGVALSSSFLLGVTILFASLIHRFADGMNIVNIIYGEERNLNKALKYLFLDSLAPVIGVLISIVLPISDRVISIILSVFAGAFLYIGFVELLPESMQKFGKRKTVLIALLGVFVIYLSTLIGGH